jgi:hypothetical protein
MMMHKIAIGLAAAIIAIGGSTLSASAARGGGGPGGGMSGGGFSKGGMPRGSMGRTGMRIGGIHGPGRVSGLEGRYPRGHVYGAEGRYRRDHEPFGRRDWCRFHPEKCGRWETKYWSRWGRYGGGYGGGYGRGSCWRWVETRFGPERRWVCGPGYGRGYGSASTYRYGGSYSKWVPGRPIGLKPGPKH